MSLDAVSVPSAIEPKMRASAIWLGAWRRPSFNASPKPTVLSSKDLSSGKIGDLRSA